MLELVIEKGCLGGVLVTSVVGALLVELCFKGVQLQSVSALLQSKTVAVVHTHQYTFIQQQCCRPQRDWPTQFVKTDFKSHSRLNYSYRSYRFSLQAYQKGYRVRSHFSQRLSICTKHMRTCL